MEGKPQLHQSAPDDILRTFYQLKVEEIRELPSFDDRNFYVRVARDVSVSQRSRLGNDLMNTFGNEYVLKVYNSIATTRKRLEAQLDMMLALKGAGICSTQSVPNVNGYHISCAKIKTTDLTIVTEDNMACEQDVGHVTEHFVVLLTYIPGHTFKTCAPYSTKLLFQYGQLVGGITRALKVCEYPISAKQQSIWCLDAVVNLRSFTSVITDSNRRKLVDDVINAFEKEVVPIKLNLKQGVIHGDINDSNVIVRCHRLNKPSLSAISSPSEAKSIACYGSDGEGEKKADDPVNDVTSEVCKDCEVVGIIDFADASFSFIIYEIAIAMAHVMLDCDDPVSAGGHVLAGYLSSAGPDRQLNAFERSVLPTCLVARLAQAVTLVLHAHAMDPSNDHVMRYQEKSWHLLEMLWKQWTKDELNRKWNDVTKQFYGLSFSSDE